MKVKLEVCPNRPKRQELFNLKNVQCQQTLREITHKTEDFHRSLEGNVKNVIKISRWKNTLDTYCARAFKKIRVRPKKGAEKLIDKRNQLKKQIETKASDKIQEEIIILDQEIHAILHNKAKSNSYQF